MRSPNGAFQKQTEVGEREKEMVKSKGRNGELWACRIRDWSTTNRVILTPQIPAIIRVEREFLSLHPHPSPMEKLIAELRWKFSNSLSGYAR